MRNLVLAALLLLLPTVPGAARLEYLTIGPMLHWNFSGYRFSSFSLGLECAYWNYRSDAKYEDETWGPFPDLSRPGYGMDFGIELDRHGFRLYSEPQLGWVFAGLSAGPVAQLSWGERPISFGLQGSGWINPLIGLDFRYRRLAGRHTQALGLYVKAATQVSGPGGAPAEDF